MRTLLIIAFTGSLMMNPVIANSATQNAPNPRPSESFRGEHKEIKTHLLHIEQWAGDLEKLNSAEQKKTMTKIVKFFKEHIEPHAQWEERKLYPAVDRRASQGPHPFTASMRYEHQIVGRRIAELEKESALKNPDARLFMRKTDQLLGLITAHFEEEEEVLLPVLDKSMTMEEFKKEMGNSEKH